MMRRMRVPFAACCLAGLLCCAAQAAPADNADRCPPTPQDALGPFYKPGAPIRSEVGKGYVLKGTVRSAGDCAPLKGAQLEFWLAGPDGRYDDGHRATLFSAEGGAYRFQSNVPPPYVGRPPHIHILVTAAGHRPLITQHYPQPGAGEAQLDLVLQPAP